MKRLILFLVFLPTFALGDPGPATRYLINEPASLMDIGILRMELELRSDQEIYEERSYAAGSGNFADYVHISIDYNYSDDIIGTLVFIRDYESNAEEIANGCKEVLGDLVAVAELSYETWFSHIGYQTGRQPADFSSTLKQRFEFRCTGNAIAEKINVSVRADLMSDRMYVATSKFDDK